MKRGDIYWVDMDGGNGSEINKTRPCVIVSITPINKFRRTVIIVPLSSSASPNPPIVISSTTNLNKPGTLVCDQIRAVDKQRLKQKIGQLSEEDLQNLEDSLRTILGL